MEGSFLVESACVSLHGWCDLASIHATAAAGSTSRGHGRGWQAVAGRQLAPLPDREDRGIDQQLEHERRDQAASITTPLTGDRNGTRSIGSPR
jgi:hypothetical protein